MPKVLLFPSLALVLPILSLAAAPPETSEVSKTSEVYGAPTFEASSFVNGLTNDGEDLSCDLPGSQHIRNIGSKLDGAGMCVFSSIEMSALHAGLEQMRGWRNWVASKYRGGGYPSKVDSTLAAWFKLKNVTPIPYMQYEGPTPEQVLDLAAKTGRLASITYGYSPRYGSGSIAHMTCCPHFSGKYGVCLDNNFIGEDRYEWMSRTELVRRIKYPGRSGWVFVWLASGPPPSPRSP